MNEICKYLKRIWLAVDADYDSDSSKEEFTLTCTNDECPDCHSLLLNTYNCNQDYCSYFEVDKGND